MQTSTIVWIVVAIVVIAIIVMLVMRRTGARRAEAERAKAAEIREAASQHDRQLREREASAAEARAQAEMARAEAQKRQLDAERLAAEAEGHADTAATMREKRDEQARLADLRDPDVRTDDEGYRIDEQGNRLGAAARREDSTGPYDGMPEERGGALHDDAPPEDYDRERMRSAEAGPERHDGSDLSERDPGRTDRTADREV